MSHLIVTVTIMMLQARCQYSVGVMGLMYRPMQLPKFT